MAENEDHNKSYNEIRDQSSCENLMLNSFFFFFLNPNSTNKKNKNTLKLQFHWKIQSFCEDLFADF